MTDNKKQEMGKTKMWLVDLMRVIMVTLFPFLTNGVYICIECQCRLFTLTCRNQNILELTHAQFYGYIRIKTIDFRLNRFPVNPIPFLEKFINLKEVDIRMSTGENMCDWVQSYQSFHPDIKIISDCIDKKTDEITAAPSEKIRATTEFITDLMTDTVTDLELSSDPISTTETSMFPTYKSTLGKKIDTTRVFPIQSFTLKEVKNPSMETMSAMITKLSSTSSKIASLPHTFSPLSSSQKWIKQKSTGIFSGLISFHTTTLPSLIFTSSQGNIAPMSETLSSEKINLIIGLVIGNIFFIVLIIVGGRKIQRIIIFRRENRENIPQMEMINIRVDPDVSQSPEPRRPGNNVTEDTDISSHTLYHSQEYSGEISPFPSTESLNSTQTERNEELINLWEKQDLSHSPVPLIPKRVGPENSDLSPPSHLHHRSSEIFSPDRQRLRDNETQDIIIPSSFPKTSERKHDNSIVSTFPDPQNHNENQFKQTDLSNSSPSQQRDQTDQSESPNTSTSFSSPILTSSPIKKEKTDTYKPENDMEFNFKDKETDTEGSEGCINISPRASPPSSLDVKR